MNYKKYLFVGLLLIGVALAVAACNAPQTPTPTALVPTQQACPTCPTAQACPEAPACPTPAVADIPFMQAWAESPHADATAEAFRHWDEDSPKEVPTNCARCHTPTGYMDYLGADGSAAGAVDVAQPVSNGITCIACHNDTAVALSEVSFPSGAVVSDLGPSARCMVCHQGRSSGVNVNETIATLVLTDTLDTVSTDLNFMNIHYFAAAATLYGNVTNGGYQYADQTYDGKFLHAGGLDTCIDCHDQHTLEVKVSVCQECHTNVTSKEDLVNIRMNGSLEDYNGNGNVTEGISAELGGLRDMLLQAIQAYGKEVAGVPIGYEAGSNPYFFTDTNDNGAIDPEEANRENAYASWTARLLKAAFNYQLSVKDPGAFAHNAKYVIELLYDSIADLNTKLSTPVDLSKAHRIDAGHFAATEMAFRDWDADGAVPATCSKCHSATGIPLFISEANASDGVSGVTIAQPVSQGFQCTTCHDVANFPNTYSVSAVKFPSGAVLSFPEAASANICIECHQGRESTVSVNKVLANKPDDTVDATLRFRNPHYFGAGATLFGTEAQGAYEYTGKTYLGHHGHVEAGLTCISCHNAHSLEINTQLCTVCHGAKSTPDTIRMGANDYDGDANTIEGMFDEVNTMEALLYAAIQKYAADKASSPIVYSAGNYPYFFIDTNANGNPDASELSSDNSYKSWTPRLLRAAYNYQWVQKDPGAFTHNGKYILQVLYDSIADVGGDVANLTRP